MSPRGRLSRGKSSVRFIHTADIHLDSPFAGLSDKTEAPVERLKGCTRQALGNLVDYAIAEGIDFVVIAGDLYDGNWKDYATGLYFVRQMGLLGRANIPVYVLHGNHDAESKITRKLTMPENVRVFPAKQPHTHHLREHNVALHGQSFATPAVTENLARTYPEAAPGCFNIGVLHTAAGGREGHANYAPCAIEDLLAKDYEYWALGHVHAREILHEYPHVVFPGNLQGRNIRETGSKGFTVVTVEEQRIKKVEHVPADVVRWSRADVDATGCVDANDAIGRAAKVFASEVDKADDRLIVLRVTFTGRTELDGFFRDRPDTLLAECRATAAAVSENIWIEKVRAGTTPVHDVNAAASRPDAIGALVRSVDELKGDQGGLAVLAAELEKLIAKLPEDLGPDAASFRRLEGDRLADIIEDAKVLLVNRLLEGAAE